MLPAQFNRSIAHLTQIALRWRAEGGSAPGTNIPIKKKVFEEERATSSSCDFKTVYNAHAH